ncbi:(2Fe-2S)-binding protein [Rhizobium mesosinicum]|uniref:(2Fe-2S)-binding protein n=1 Tax=Rhizobium mesosinicum TaxID=335017 RepID=A0ABS7GLZ4_9HYPH|nr:(2Fe-2S)-binding protein [Rhizobium mesosinicum]MBW9051037.1 (2Fe-2S)-binding protein [Rhizobium mesosinicum]
MPYSLNVNGESKVVDADGDTPLLWALRDILGLTGTKFGCGAGLCGCCTVMLDGVATRGCQTPIESVGTSKIVTIEGINRFAAGEKIQQAWLDLEVVQCGYCQPGQMVSATALLNENANPSDADIDQAMSGNLCRCGTYNRIREAIKHAAASQANSSESAR